jgi:hypothetical protein
MKIKLCLLLTVLLWTSGILQPSESFQNQKEKQQKKEENVSLLRKDLLVPSKKSFPPPKRNIFLRQRKMVAGGEVDPSTGIPIPGQQRSTAQSESVARQKSAAERVQSNVKYIGYVQSGKKVVALIILGGDSYAVQSGDVLDTGLSIGEITPDEMEIFDRGQEAIRIKLEGEKP